MADVTLTLDPSTLLVSVEAPATLDLDGIRRLGDSVRAVEAGIRREQDRRRAYEARAETLAMHIRLYPDGRLASVVRPPRPVEEWRVALYPGPYGETWLTGVNPETGRTKNIPWYTVPRSPWGPVWLARSRGGPAHAWTGGGKYACGIGMPMPWDNHRAAYRTESSRECAACTRALATSPAALDAAAKESP